MPVKMRVATISVTGAYMIILIAMSADFGSAIGGVSPPLAEEDELGSPIDLLSGVLVEVAVSV
jgi:hypothetical protein